MIECRNGATLLAALKLEEELNIDEIMNKTKIDDSRRNTLNAFKNVNMSYIIKSDKIRQLNVRYYLNIFFHTFKKYISYIQ